VGASFFMRGAQSTKGFQKPGETKRKGDRKAARSGMTKLKGRCRDGKIKEGGSGLGLDAQGIHKTVRENQRKKKKKKKGGKGKSEKCRSSVCWPESF